MPISVASWAQVADWFVTGDPQIVAVSWSKGDRIVILAIIENNGDALNNPTLTGFTIGAPVVSTAGTRNGAECYAYIWTTDAAASAGSGNISSSHSSGTGTKWGMCAWVITGNPSTTNGVNSGNDNFTESALSLAVSARSILLYGLGDWNATNNNETPLTGSGTATERRDNGDLTTYGQYVADWVGTAAGTFSFGPSTYTGMQSAQVAVEIKEGTPTTTLLTSGTASPGTGSFTPASITTASGSILVVGVSAVPNGAFSCGSDLTITDDRGLTWTRRIAVDSSTSFQDQGAMWTAPVTTGQATQITFDAGARDVFSAGWFVWQVTDYDTTTPIGGKASTFGNTTDGAATITLDAAPSSADTTIAMVGFDGDTSGTHHTDVGADFTEDGELSSTTNSVAAQAQHRTGSTSTTVGWADLKSGTMNLFSTVQMALVIKAPGSGGGFSMPNGKGASSSSGKGTLALATALVGKGASAASGKGTLYHTGGPAPLESGSYVLLEGGTDRLMWENSDNGGGAIALSGKGAAASSGKGTLSIATALQGKGNSATSGKGTAAVLYPLSGKGSASSSGKGTATVAYPLSGKGSAAASGKGTASVATALNGKGGASSSGNGTLSIATALVGKGASASSGKGTLPTGGPIALVGKGSTASSGKGTLSVTYPIGGKGASASSGKGTLSIATALQGKGASASSAKGTASIATALSGKGSSAATAKGTASIATALTGKGSSSASGKGTLAIATALVGKGASAASGKGTLTPPSGALSGKGGSASSAKGTLSIATALQGKGSTAASAKGTASIATALSGKGSAASSAKGTLGLASLVGKSGTASSGKGTLRVLYPLSGKGASSSSARATLSVRYALQGRGSTSSSGRGNLRMLGSYAPAKAWSSTLGQWVTVPVKRYDTVLGWVADDRVMAYVDGTGWVSLNP